jgi:hypothetical protein
MWRDLFNAITYRTAGSDPNDFGLEVTYGRWGRRTVHHPDLPALLEARRRRALTHGLDPIDRALLDPATVALLRATAARMAAGQRRAPVTVPSDFQVTSRAGPPARVPARR